MQDRGTFRDVEGMSATDKADPAIYQKMRTSALESRNTNVPSGAVYLVLMDWHVGNGTVSVLAAVDGTASIYFSSGGGFIGGGQKYPEIREAAVRAVQLATGLLSRFDATGKTRLPPSGAVNFYVTTFDGVRLATAEEADLSNGTDSLLPLGNAMQQIVTLYRLKFPQQPSKN
jgi:hypothetical protein